MIAAVASDRTNQVSRVRFWPGQGIVLAIIDIPKVTLRAGIMPWMRQRQRGSYF
jgi:hypothetical protein